MSTDFFFFILSRFTYYGLFSSHRPLCQTPLMSMAFRRISRSNARPLPAPHRKTEDLGKTIGQSQNMLSNTGPAALCIYCKCSMPCRLPRAGPLSPEARAKDPRHTTSVLWPAACLLSNVIGNPKPCDIHPGAIPRLGRHSVMT